MLRISEELVFTKTVHCYAGTFGKGRKAMVIARYGGLLSIGLRSKPTNPKIGIVRRTKSLLAQTKGYPYEVLLLSNVIYDSVEVSSWPMALQVFR